MAIRDIFFLEVQCYWKIGARSFNPCIRSVGSMRRRPMGAREPLAPCGVDTPSCCFTRMGPVEALQASAGSVAEALTPSRVPV